MKQKQNYVLQLDLVSAVRAAGGVQYARST